MKPKIVIYIVFILSTIFPSFAVSQLKDKSLDNADMNRESYYLEPLVFYQKDSLNGRLDLYVELFPESLQFKYNPSAGRYEASIDYTVIIKNSSDNIFYNNIYTESFSNTEAEQKNLSNKYVFSLKQFILPPGQYKLNFNIRDKNTSNESSKDIDVTVNDYSSKKLSYSSIMLLSDYKIDAEGKKDITPIVDGNIGNYKEFFLFFDIINNSDSMIYKEYAYRIYNEAGKNFAEGNFNYYLQPGENKNIERIPESNFIIGNYKLDIVDKNQNEIVVHRFIKYYWSDLPVNIKDLDAAIDQLIYIATSDQLSYIRKGKTFEEKERRFLKFWRDKDPTPNTPRNELMSEYYSRIKIANERYSHYVPGWKTDMGMVYIIYGNPSNIDRHPFDSDAKPYEVWDYYDSNKRFIFVDYSGFGDYRLITPFYDEEKTKLHF